MELTPKTRKEVFLATAGGQDVNTPTPITREEVFLDEIAKGGGGSSLPSTETASAGDVLSLDENKEPQWTAPSGGGGVLVVNVTETESETNYIYTCDKTAGEILSALEEKVVIFKYESGYFESCVGGGPYLGGYKFVRGGTSSSGDVQFTALALTDYPYYED